MLPAYQSLHFRSRILLPIVGAAVLRVRYFNCVRVSVDEEQTTGDRSIDGTMTFPAVSAKVTAIDATAMT